MIMFVRCSPFTAVAGIARQRRCAPISVVFVGAILLGVMFGKAAAGPIAYEYAGELAKECNSTDMGRVNLCEGFIGAILEVVTNNKIYGTRVCAPQEQLL
jgi:hypothetical protein